MLLTVIKLSKSGYGSIREILEMPTEVVLSVIEYENFLPRYESTVVEMNRKIHEYR